MTTLPIIYTWNGEVMTPLPRFQSACQEFEVGGHYRLASFEERSTASHGHYFASVHEAYVNLPEDIAGDFASAEHLRKWALIKAGYRDERSIVASSKAEALRIASYIRPMDEFAIVVVREATVTQYIAKSQSMRAMGKVEFQASKDAVFEVLAKLIGTDVSELQGANAA